MFATALGPLRGVPHSRMTALAWSTARKLSAKKFGLAFHTIKPDRSNGIGAWSDGILRSLLKDRICRGHDLRRPICDEASLPPDAISRFFGFWPVVRYFRACPLT